MEIKRTYSSRNRQTRQEPPSSPVSTLTPSSPIANPQKRKRPLQEWKNIPHPPKRAKTKQAVKTLTQLHFCIDQTILRTCPDCGLSYTKGAPDDEILHRAHCARVRRGMEWGKEEEKEKIKANVVDVANGVKLKDGKKGRIICFPADAGGKVGAKLALLLQTINFALSSPPLVPEVLRASKAYLFLIPHELSSRERIVGCVIAQRISTAMAVASRHEYEKRESENSDSTKQLITVDVINGVFCYPQPLPTPMGIPRLFVSSSLRRKGIASKLLTAAAETFIHGCPLDPRKGQIAFTQPTGDGNAVMRGWGGEGMRIYEE